MRARRAFRDSITCLAVAALGAAGCGGSPATRDGGADGDAGPPPCMGECPERVAEIPVTPDRRVDLLFLIDNSGTMFDEHDALRGAFPAFLDGLMTLEGGLPDLHIGVVTSNMGADPSTVGNCEGRGDDGILQNTTSRDEPCPIADRWISDVAAEDGTRVTNYTGSLSAAFDCISSVGIDGCGFEQHLEAIRRALVDQPLNEGFLRDGSILAVVIVADEDDCSASDPSLFDIGNEQLGPLASFRCTEYGISCDGMPIARDPSPRSYEMCEPDPSSMYLTHPDEFVEALRELRPDPRKLVVTGIIGPATPFAVGPETTEPWEAMLQPSCGSVDDGAYPAVRLEYFLDRFAPRSYDASICEPELAPALHALVPLLERAIGTLCLAGAIDATDRSASEPGLQPACTVSDVLGFGTSAEQATPLPPCEMIDASQPDLAASEAPCWWVEIDPMCDTETDLSLRVERETPPDPLIVVTVDCVLED